MTDATKKKITKWFWILFITPIVLVAGLIGLVWAFADIPSFEDLENPDSKLATQVIAEDGEILHLPIPGGADRYDGTVADHGHYFCRLCGAFGDIATERMAERLAPRGFAVDGLLLIVDGRCADCVGRDKTEA